MQHIYGRSLSSILLGACLGLVPGCLQRPIGVAEPQTTNLIVDRVTQTAVDKIDLLFMIDNSISMADKQAILELAVPVLVRRLVNPVCVTPDGVATQPASAEEECSGNASREFPPVKDIHVGVITSSMGDAGANANCVFNAAEPSSAETVDNGHLIGSLPRGGGTSPGFLAWNGSGAEEFVSSFGAHVTGVGEKGCGFEASMESWYHFLVDPAPWSSIEAVDCAGAPAGSANCRAPKIVQADGSLGDPTVLAQRAAFLRPDSLVVVAMLTDENDCSIIAGGQYSIVARTDLKMYRASDACATDPNDKCCFSCGSLVPPDGCAPCAGEETLPPEVDEANLRCLDQKRRFGVDFLYPTKRYVNALTSPTLCTTNADLDPTNCRNPADVRPNPLLAGSETGLARDPSLIFFAGIVGVPWQLIQATADDEGRPFPGGELHFKSSQQLAESDGAGGPSGWDRIAGPEALRDVHMLESIASDLVGPRPGLPDSRTPLADPISGHEFFTKSANDLQYACTFPLPDGGRDCADPEFSAQGRACDCKQAAGADYTENNPLCYDGQSFGTHQVASKAYPGIRPLRALQEFGEKVKGNAIVASICARNVDSAQATAQDFGYNPAVAAIVDRLKEKLKGRCLARELDVEEIDHVGRGKPSCSIVEATPSVPESTAPCECNPAEARTTPNPKVIPVIKERMRDGGLCPVSDPDCQLACLCEMMPAGGAVAEFGGVIIPPAGHAAYSECQTVENAEVDGWCYVDRNIPVITGDRALEDAKNALVAPCPAAEKRLLRFQGAGAPKKGSTTFIACRGASIVDAQPAPQ